MAAFSLHGFSFYGHFRRTTMWIVYFSVLGIYFDGFNCAKLTNIAKDKDFRNLDTENNNDTLSHRQLYSVEQILAANNPINPYIHTPSFGFPFYQNLQQFAPAEPIGSSDTGPPPSTSQKKRIKVKNNPDGEADESLPKVSAEDLSSDIVKKTSTKTKQKKEKRKKEKLQQEGNELEKVESKTVGDEGTERGCPACVSGTCDALLDPSTNISGIPVIQILVALVVGAFWAAIFAFILHNFIEYKEEGGGGGYGYGESPTPEYGAPTSQYGAPQSEYGAPPTGYSTNNRISYGNGYGRRSQGFTFNDMSNRVWDAIDKFISKYDN